MINESAVAILGSALTSLNTLSAAQAPAPSAPGTPLPAPMPRMLTGPARLQRQPSGRHPGLLHGQRPDLPPLLLTPMAQGWLLQPTFSRSPGDLNNPIDLLSGVSFASPHVNMPLKELQKLQQVSLMQVNSEAAKL